jgi:hypothetical protein
MVKNATTTSDYAARHLLVQSVNGPSNSTLRQFVHGILTEIGTGTEYEMSQSADALMREWAREGFRVPRDNELVWDPLERAVALATLMGFKKIFDPERADVRSGNALGVFPLNQWPGLTGKNGGNYLYAFTGTEIYAQPVIPRPEFLTRASASEFAQSMLQVAKSQDAVGAFCKFLLG